MSKPKEDLPIDWVEEDTGIGHHFWRDSDENIQEEFIENYKDIYGPGDPNDTGEYYTEWMPRYGGYQPDDND